LGEDYIFAQLFLEIICPEYGSEDAIFAEREHRAGALRFSQAN